MTILYERPRAKAVRILLPSRGSGAVHCRMGEVNGSVDASMAHQRASAVVIQSGPVSASAELLSRCPGWGFQLFPRAGDALFRKCQIHRRPFFLSLQAWTEVAGFRYCCPS